MSRYTLHVFPDGHAIIEGGDITEREANELRRAWRDWHEKPEAALILNGTVKRHDFDLVDDEIRIVS